MFSKLRLRKKHFKFGILVLVVILAVLIANLGMRLLNRARGKRITALAADTLGYPATVSATLYGVPAELATEMKTAAASNALSGENTAVQNLQPPSISGFSSDLFTGNSTVNYPLDLPPGRGGLTPSLSLIYSSASVYDPLVGADLDEDTFQKWDDYWAWTKKLYVQSSQVGLGWNLGGLGYVFRDAKNRYTLILNGQSYRLFKKDEESWRTEPESFLKIIHRVVDNDEYKERGIDDYRDVNNDRDPFSLDPACLENSSSSENCVKKFEITDSNGTRYAFEPQGFFLRRCDYRENGGCRQATPSKCQELHPGDYWWIKCEKWSAFFNKWVLTRIIDVHGNEMAVSYDQEKRQINCGGVQPENEGYAYPRALYPSKINYSGSQDGRFQSEVEFQFQDDRLDDENMEKKDNGCLALYWSEKRIANINIKVKQNNDWKIVRQYGLDNNDYFVSKWREGENNRQDDNKKLHLRLNKIIAYGRDDNGDGTGDQKLPSNSFSYYNDQNDPNNFRLLEKADNGYGGGVEYRYKILDRVSDFDPSTGRPRGGVFGNHQLIWKRANDGQNNTFTTVYNYENPLGISDDWDHSGFESAGYAKVKEIICQKNDSPVTEATEQDTINNRCSQNPTRTSIYHFLQGKTEQKDNVTWFYVWPERGRVEKVEIKDNNGKLLSVSETDYLREIPDGTSDYGAAQSAIWDNSHFIAAKETRSCQEPTSQWPKGNKITYNYRPEDQNGQQWGNLTQTTEYLVNNCDFNGAAYRSTHSTYFPNLDSHITNRVAETETFTCETDPTTHDCIKTKRLALSWNLYDDKGGSDPKQTPGSKGLLTLSRAFYKFPEEADATIGNRDTVDAKYEYYDFGSLKATTTYDGYGQSLSSTPGGGATRTSTIEYDTTYNTFPVLTKNSLEHITRTYYRKGETGVNHPYLADRTVTQDVNGQLWTMVVDGFGRTKETYVPGESAAQTKVAYNDVNQENINPLRVYTQTRDDTGTGNVTYHNSWQFYNGLGQVIESQSELASDGAKIALTATSYNTLGQAEKTLLPYEAVGGGTFIQPDFNRPERTEADYDALGRAIKSRTPTKTGGWYTTQTGYYGRKTAVLDPKNHLAISEIDNLGRTLETQIFNKQLFTDTNNLPVNGAQLPTDYYVKNRLDYDHLDRVKKTTTTDVDGTPAKTAVSEVSYNQFGQKEWSKDPDLGRWEYTYYPAGTLKTVTDAKGKVASFVYDKLDRIKFKYYGDTNTEPVAFFDYDNNCQNGVGRLCSDLTTNRPEDGFIGAASVYNYDAKGRLISETKRIEGQSFVTQFAYDAAGRQRTVTYPDGTHETVTYSYNDAGLLQNVANVAGAQTYLSSAKYNVLGLLEEEVLGNQGKNIYAYESRTYQLASKIVKDKNGKDLWSQNLGYDPLGNIEEITYPLRKDPVAPLPFKIKYTYDELNRLTGGQVAGLTEEAAKKIFYTRYTYDELGRMNLKQEEGEEPCNKTTVYPVNRNSALVAENLSATESGYITFNFFNNAGKSLFFVGDSVKSKSDSTELGKKSFVPILVDALSDIRSRYPNFEGFVVVESHKKVDYPGRPDGPCIKVFSGTAEELCQINPGRYSSLCGGQ